MKTSIFPLTLSILLTASGIALAKSAEKLTPETLLNNSSSAPLKLTAGRIITDNDESFEAKLNIIRNAKESLKLSYFIYTNDYSSSLFTDELIKAAKRGVKVELLVDALTNYKYLDLFSMMEKQANLGGQGSLEVRFYNFPSDKILRDIMFMTMDCNPNTPVKKGNECETEKRAKIDELVKRHNGNIFQTMNSPEAHFAQLFLAGFLTKQFDAIKAGLFVGQSIDMAKFQSAQSASPDQMAELQKLLKLILNAKVKGSVGANIQLAIAMTLYGDAVKPIMNQISGALPIMDADPESAMEKEWRHFTDYTHQKLILSDARSRDRSIQPEFMIGGRNIEDSYHLKRSSSLPVDKYIFMDTDFVGTIGANASDIADAFDLLWNWKVMTKNIDYVRGILPFDVIKNMDLYNFGLGKCLESAKSMKQQGSALIGRCAKEAFEASRNHPNFVALAQRVENEFTLMQSNRNTFESKYVKGNLQEPIALSPSDLQKSTITYIENVPYDRHQKDGRGRPALQPTRLFGVQHGKEAASGKYIHALWKRGMENVCAITAKGRERKRVVIHNAYFFSPPILLETIGNMTNGTWDCHNVDVTILTNSHETTDLNIMNLFARHQLQALFEIYRSPEFPSVKAKQARLRYFEYKESATSNREKTGHAERSLHTKVEVLGDDMIIGSANFDIRNYSMDANNGVYIANAPALVGSYLKYIDEILNDATTTVEWTPFLMDRSTTRKSAQMEDAAFMAKMQARYSKFSNRLDDKQKQKLLGVVDEVTELVYRTTLFTLRPVNGNLHDENQILYEGEEVHTDFDSLSENDKWKHKEAIREEREKKRLEMLQEFINMLQLIWKSRSGNIRGYGKE